MSHRPRPPRGAAAPSSLLPSLSLLSLLALAACSDGGGAAAAPAGAAGAGPAVAVSRSEDPRAVALREHLDLGRLDLAEPLLADPDLRAAVGVEATLLDARAAALGGRASEALRLLERARGEAPKDARVYATAAELSAAAGRHDTAEEELRRGTAACGVTPELLRAQGVALLVQPGGATRGLQHLERARELDPALPFCERALSQAHLLLGKRALSRGEAQQALEQLSLAVELDPDEVDARRALSDAWAAAGELTRAIGLIEALVADGEPLEGELALLYKRAGMAALLAREREVALGHFAHARDLGLDDEELSSAARMLVDAGLAALEEGIVAYRANELERARERFERALVYDPELLAAHNHLAVVLYQLREWSAAAEHWRVVLDAARAEGLELPEPVHLSLARALRNAGRVDEARALLEEELARDPEDDWAGATRALLESLER